MCSLEYILPAEIYGKVLLWFFYLDSPVPARMNPFGRALL